MPTLAVGEIVIAPSVNAVARSECATTLLRYSMTAYIWRIVVRG